MSNWKKVKGTASAMPIGIGVGVLLGLFLLGVITLISAWYVYNEYIPMHALGYLLMAGQLVGALSGAWFAIKRVQRRKAVVGLATGGTLFLVLMGINEAFFGGHYSGTLTTSILFLIGTMLAILFAGRERHKGYKRRGGKLGCAKLTTGK